MILVRAPTGRGRQEDMAGLELYQARADATARSLELYQAQAPASQDAISSRILRRAFCLCEPLDRLTRRSRCITIRLLRDTRTCLTQTGASCFLKVYLGYISAWHVTPPLTDSLTD